MSVHAVVYDDGEDHEEMDGVVQWTYVHPDTWVVTDPCGPQITCRTCCSMLDVMQVHDS